MVRPQSLFTNFWVKLVYSKEEGTEKKISPLNKFPQEWTPDHETLELRHTSQGFGSGWVLPTFEKKPDPTSEKKTDTYRNLETLPGSESCLIFT